MCWLPSLRYMLLDMQLDTISTLTHYLNTGASLYLQLSTALIPHPLPSTRSKSDNELFNCRNFNMCY